MDRAWRRAASTGSDDRRRPIVRLLHGPCQLNLSGTRVCDVHADRPGGGSRSAPLPEALGIWVANPQAKR